MISRILNQPRWPKQDLSGSPNQGSWIFFDVDLKTSMKNTLSLVYTAMSIAFAVMPSVSRGEVSETNTGTYLEVVAPNHTASVTLKAGEPAKFKIRYYSASARRVHIWAQPYTQGNHTPGGFFAASATETQGPGEVERFVGAKDPVAVDEIRVSMVDADTKAQLAKTSFPVHLTWEGAVPQPKNMAPVDKPFPGLKFTSIQGGEVDVERMKGKVVMVDFWATWCGPCCQIMPQVAAAYEKYHADGFEIVGISLDQNMEKLQGYTRDHKMPWPQYFDGKGWDNAVAKRFAVTSIPCFFLIDRTGVVRDINVGGGQFIEAVESLVKEGR